MSRISQLRDEANHTLSKIKTGSHQKRQYRKRAIHRFIDSLSASRHVPISWYALRQEHIASVVKYWKNIPLKDESIRKYVGELRYFLQAINHDIREIDNKSLGLTPANKSDRNHFHDDCLQKISDEVVRLVLKLQTEFGLTLSEAFRFNPDLHNRDDHLLLSRDMTNNSKDRVIYVYCQSQSQTLAEAEELIACNSNPIQQCGYSGIRERYRFQIKDIGLTPSVNYRYVFAAKRMHFLQQSNPVRQAKLIVVDEMGISPLTLRRYLNEQNQASKR